MQTGHAISPDRLGAPVPGTEKQGVRAAAKIKHTESSCNCFRTNPIPAAPRTENKGFYLFLATSTGSSHVLLLMDFQYLQQEVMAAGFMSL